MTDVTTTRARAWALRRADGAVMGFTDHDRDLEFEGIAFRARTGMTARALVQATGLSVDNTEAAGALSDDGLSEADILAGRYDGAALTIWEVDWTDPDARRILFRGTLGEVTRAGGAFRAELHGLSAPLGQGGGRVFGAVCPAVLGGDGCGFDTGQPGFSVEADLLEVDEGGAVLDVPALPAFEAGWFDHGTARFLDGPAAGSGGFVRREWLEAGHRRLALWAAPAMAPEPGNRLRLEAGCDKRFETCRLKFDNVLNFQGFPHIPGEDWSLAVPRGDGRDDGGRRE
ncbi:MAG: protein of unknown function (DUF2163) [Rhodobacteraceae bacterium HLUCCA12]|nr:MAG: protein of unknown function (DUF2163) [Rhodobacteraceae bacterium HLUCCA12]